MPRWSRPRLRRDAAAILASGLRAADPWSLVRRVLRLRGGTLSVAGRALSLGRGRLVLVAAGKAAGAMAGAAEAVLGGRLSAGLAVDTVARRDLARTQVLVASHPVPDRRGLEAAREVERLAGSLGHDDTLLCLLSGGASALLPAPVVGVSLEEKAAVTGLLLRSGADIAELNAVRKHLSRLKGGGLARAAAPAQVVCLALSDVTGDDLSTIASGPTVPDPSSYADALEVLRRRGLLDSVPAAVRRRLVAGAHGEVEETPKPGDPCFRRAATCLIGSNRLSLEAAAREAGRRGWRPVILTSRLSGEAREAAHVLVSILRECVETGHPAAPPVCLLAGGETTVTVRGDGRGGRNQELAAAAAADLSCFPVPAVVASLATDGVDGNSEAAGGVVDDRTLATAESLGLAPLASFLAASDSQAFLAPLGGLILTGPTGTNVADLTVLLVGRARATRRPRSRSADRRV